MFAGAHSQRSNSTWKSRNLKTLLKALVVAVISLSFLNTGFAGDKMKDCVHMKDGKMMMMKDGKEMAMEKEMTMTDGSKVTTAGEHVMKDGKKMKLKDGDMVMMDGTMMAGDTKKDKEAEKK
jgi:endonuclease V-like protein UPF0215 family